jgi:hypothetical protein
MRFSLTLGSSTNSDPPPTAFAVTGLHLVDGDRDAVAVQDAGQDEAAVACADDRDGGGHGFG